MVNSNRELIFSQLLKDDDGVLRGLLMESGLSDIETAATIDRFIFELRHATENIGAEFEMEGLGTMNRDREGRLTFTPSTQKPERVEPTKPEPPTEESPTEEPTTEEPTPTKVSIEDVCQKIEQANTAAALNKKTMQKGRGHRANKGVDKVIVLGIVAAVVAIAAIAYGLYASNIEVILELLAK